MKVILKRPGECAKLGWLPDRHSMCDFCDGTIDSVSLFTPSGKQFFVVSNFEFFINKSLFNMWLGGTQFFGNIFVCGIGLNESGVCDFVGLTDDDIEDIVRLLDWSDRDRVSLLSSCITP